MQLVLASSSPYRRQLLARLMLPFEVMSPDVDETPLAGEKPWETALRLAQRKASAVAEHFPRALVIGSDQVAVLDDAILGKPGHFQKAKEQLMAASGREVTFHTALALLNAATGRMQAKVVPFGVKFRVLTEAQIERYLHREQPYDCAGSAKSEGLGITLIERFIGDDPNALVGLPLIALVDMLRDEGIELP